MATPRNAKVKEQENSDVTLVNSTPAVSEDAAEEKKVTRVDKKENTVQKQKPKLDDSVLIRVKSNTYGHLIYINQRTGDRTDWENFGDEQTITMGDLRAMRGTQNAFYSDNMIIVVGCEDDRYKDLTPADIYDALMVSKYYKHLIDPDNFSSLFYMDEGNLKERISAMSSNARINLVLALNESIRNGSLDSIRRVHLFEELLGCELATIE